MSASRARRIGLCCLVLVGLVGGARAGPNEEHGHRSVVDGKFEADSVGRADEQWRLPPNLVPYRYTLRLLPFFEDRDFLTEGYIDMYVECVQDTFNVTFNINGVTIDIASITVVQNDNNLSLAVAQTIDEPNFEKFTIATQSSLNVGVRYKVSMKFSYQLSVVLNGFYRTYYVENGVTKWMAGTQFEAARARKAFPCFDEPAMKAQFLISLGRKESWTALTSTPKFQTAPNEDEPGYVWDFFEPTVTMSTYLVAFVVSELDVYLANPSLSNVEFRIWARPDRIGDASFAADIGPRISEYFESYFEIDYALPKQDMAAVPRYGGAMENWGLIIYGEGNLLYDSTVNTAVYKYNVAEVIAHELAHQWTGNYVTCKWWNVIWLNEGYAQLMQYYGVAGVLPELEPFQQFPVRTFQPTLVYDSAPTRPINQPVTSPSESQAMFDTITYSKGACIIRMMSGFLGEETFRKAMNLYMTRRAFQSADQDDLFTAMNDQAVMDEVLLPVPVKTIMDTWTFQMGYPLVTVTRNYEDGLATITQERFLRVADDDETVYKWWVPLTYRTASSSAPSAVWINETLTTGVDFGASSTDWLLANVDQMGYYRVMYDPENYGLLSDQLVADPNQISVNNRAQLLDDAFNLALLGRISYADALTLTLYMAQEKAYSPWHAVLPELKYVDSMFRYNAAYGEWKRYMSARVAPYFDSIGMTEKPSDAHLTILSRSNAITWACDLDIVECTRNATLQFIAWSNAPVEVEVISRNQKSQILCAGMASGSESDWEFVYNRFLAASDQRSSLAATLGCTEVGWLHSRLLEMMIDRPENVTTSDGDLFFRALADNPSANRVAFDFLRDRWDDLASDYSGSTMVNFFRQVSDTYNTQIQLEQLVTLRNQHMDVLGNQGVDEAIALVEANIQWMEVNAQIITDWLTQH